MQKLIFIFSIFLLFSSCGGTSTSNEEEEDQSEDALQDEDNVELEEEEDPENGQDEINPEEEAQLTWRESEQMNVTQGENYYELRQSTIEALNQVNCTPSAKFLERYSSLKSYAGNTYSTSVVVCTKGQENRSYLLREYPHRPGGNHLLCDLCKKIVLPQQLAYKNQIGFEMVGYAVSENKYCSVEINKYVSEDMGRGYRCEWYVTPRNIQMAGGNRLPTVQEEGRGPRGNTSSSTQQSPPPQTRGGQMQYQRSNQQQRRGGEPRVIIEEQQSVGEQQQWWGNHPSRQRRAPRPQ